MRNRRSRATWFVRFATLVLLVAVGVTAVMVFRAATLPSLQPGVAASDRKAVTVDPQAAAGRLAGALRIAPVSEAETYPV
ncbi:MAG: hypothetical protein ONB06_08475, partial [candidate division KSB1 bacterium]|nr:hypothetical protein [candidate division KSB1 bacterium]